MKKVKKPTWTWVELNELIRGADEGTCHRMLRDEQRGRRRKKFLQRIHSRLNKARADRERAELVS